LGDVVFEHVRAAGDPTESDDFDEAADRFEEAAAARAELTHHLGRDSWAVEPGLAGHALGVGHQEPLSVGRSVTMSDMKIKKR
jgi:hypothetical protein